MKIQWLGLTAVTVIATMAAYAAGEQKSDPVARALEHADVNKDGQVTLEELRQVKPNVTPEQFQKLDRNSDKVLSEADTNGGVADRLSRSDFDGDGKVSLDEAQKVLPGMSDDVFRRLDRNQDGALSPADRTGEAQRARMRDRLHKADLNRDGRVSFDEARQQFPEMTQERFSRLDRNGDGFLNQEDAPQNEDRLPIATRLRNADANNDGNVTFEEAAVEFPNITRERFDQFDKNGDGVLTAKDLNGAVGRQQAPASAPLDAAGQQLAAADADGDGKVSYEEVVAAKPGYPRESFDRIDENKDGFITRADLE